MTDQDRQSRRRLERALRNLTRRGLCSFCGSPLETGTPTSVGFDANGKVVLTAECCVKRVSRIFGLGLELPGNSIAAASQKKAVDKLFDCAEQFGSWGRPPKVDLSDSAWKNADRDWFERNPKRLHRARRPFPGEVDEETADVPAGHVLIILVRKVNPSFRLRAVVALDSVFLPVPDEEGAAYALLEVASGREAVPVTGKRSGH